MTVNTRLADIGDLAAVAALFDAYRQFYAQPADLALARHFMRARLSEGSSLVLVAEDGDGTIIAFTQLYPLYDSISAMPSYVLYDVFVAPSARRLGAARALMQAAVEQARQRGAGRVELQTARDNVPAQALYEGLGWQRDEDFLIYAIHP